MICHGSRSNPVLALSTLGLGLLLATTIPGGPAAQGVTAPSAGQVLGLGYNASGQLGIGTSDAGVHATPAAASLPSGAGAVVAVSAGSDHSLFATANGLYSVGSNTYGQLGVTTDVGTSTPVTTPVAVTLPGQNGTVTAVGAGTDFSVVLTSSGQLYTFGSDATASLGRATTPVGSYDATPTLVALPDGGTATMISSGAYHSLVLSSSGKLYGFGSDQYGQLGDGMTGTSDGLKPVTGLPVSSRSTRVLALATGADHSLVLRTNGMVYGFGRNNDGQLGSTAGTTLATTATAITSLPAGSVTAISAGYEMSIAVVGGTVYTWGDDSSGQLGYQTDAGFDPSSTPTALTLPSGSGSVTGVTAAALFSDVFTASGQVISFGSDDYGQLGRAPTSSGYDDNPHLVTLPAGTTVDTGSVGGGQQDIFLPVSDISVGAAGLPSGTVGTAYSATVPTSGGLAPLSVVGTLGGLPAGLYQTAAGGIAGTPSAAGTSSVSVTVSDADGVVASGNLSLTIASAATPTSPPTSTSTPSTTTAPAASTAAPSPATTAPSRAAPAPAAVALPSASALKAALLAALVPTGKGARIGNLLKHGYVQSLTVLEPGRAVITWSYQPKHGKKITVATGTAVFTHAGLTHLTVKLTNAGAALLRAGHRVGITFTATYGRVGQKNLVASKTGTLA